MDSILIKGGRPLVGEIKISGAKNSVLPLMAAAMLTADRVTLTNIPKLSDVITMTALLNNHGTEITSFDCEKAGYTLNICAQNITNYTAPYDIVRKMRASIWVLGPLLARFGKAIVSLPGGCTIGARQVDLHIKVMEALGAEIKIENGYIHAGCKGRLRGGKLVFPIQSVGATINAILAAVLAEGESNFSNCATEPEIVDLCNFLNKMGAEIKNIGTTELSIIGKSTLYGAAHKVIPDRIEAGTYMLAAAATKGNVKLKGVNYDLVANLVKPMKLAGSAIKTYDDIIEVSHVGEIKPVNISTAPYPGFPTDLQAQFMSFMTLADGLSVIEENIFEDRFMHVPELCRMGADITIKDHKSYIKGVRKLTGAQVMASDLRASVSLIISGLCAQGETRVRRVYHLDRGYERLEEKLANCGADIKRVKGDDI